MPDSELLTRYAGRIVDERAPASSEVEALSYDDLVAFGWLRGLNANVPMLELRKRSGNIVAIGYAWLERVEFNPSEGILLNVGDQRITIRGRNLNAEMRPGVRLFEGIARHRVPWIREAGRADAIEADDKACVIDAIEW